MLHQAQTFVRTTSLRMALGRVASLRSAPERTFPDRFFPVKSHCRRSRILSDTAFACKAHKPQTKDGLLHAYQRTARSNLAPICHEDRVSCACSSICSHHVHSPRENPQHSTCERRYLSYSVACVCPLTAVGVCTAACTLQSTLQTWNPPQGRGQCRHHGSPPRAAR